MCLYSGSDNELLVLHGTTIGLRFDVVSPADDGQYGGDAVLGDEREDREAEEGGHILVQDHQAH